MIDAPQNQRRGSLPVVLDVGLALALLAALGMVFALAPWLDPPKVAESQTPDDVEIPEEPSTPLRTLRLGVTPSQPQFDDMGHLLTTLGEGYKYTSFPLEDLLEYGKFGEYEVIFLTCSGVPESWLGQMIGQGTRAGTQMFTANEAVFNRVSENLRQFVGNGGTLYASDLHFKLIARTFPDLIDQNSAREGKVQEIVADVVHPELKELLGAQMPLRFDQPSWQPAAFQGEKLVTYLRGEYATSDGELRTAPLLVKFPYKDGTVIFTSFHNEKQNSETETKLLKYLVFSAVTAQMESKINKTLVQGGFSPAQQGLFSASAQEPSVTKTYQCTQAGPLQFVLGFDNQGGKLRLTVTPPAGKALEKEGSSTLTIDVPNAAVGQWKYTVTAIKIPYANFTYRVTVGQKK